MIAWVFFRTETATEAFAFIKALCGGNQPGPNQIVIAKYFNIETQIALACGLIGCIPWARVLEERRKHFRPTQWMSRIALESSELVGLFIILSLVVIRLSAATYNPFIYFRF
jgi:hypothetical protein